MSGNLNRLDLQEWPSFIAEDCRNNSSAGETLTVLEQNILKLMAYGNSSQEISKLLYLSIRTLYDHHINIMNKLNFNNPLELNKYAINEGYRYKKI
jgi:DNA-binding NarL/FixJ family response regulator